MKIAIVAPTHMPATRANTIQVAKMTQAFCMLGHEVQLAIPARNPMEVKSLNEKIAWDDFALHYGLHTAFPLHWLVAAPWLRRYDYGLRSLQWARNWKAEIIYTRLPQCAAIASLLGMPVIYEAHDFPKGIFATSLLRGFLWGKGKRRLVLITHALHSALSTKYALSNVKDLIVVAPDGVDIERYKDLSSPKDARRSLVEKYPDLPDRFTVGYSGNLYAGRGIEFMIELAAHLPEINFFIMGGGNGTESRFKKVVKERSIQNIFITGFIPNAELPLYQACCEVLLMPYEQKIAASSGGDIAAYLSPMKVFEYMACGRVIVSSDLPVLREILDEDFAFLLPIGYLEVWIDTLQHLVQNPRLIDELGKKAFQQAQKYSWLNRAGKILQGLS